ncbi:MAG: 50S ribosomal protein L9 [Firmicutes bacterium]|nr:50S ribosomal protein L9 [Bacillota bacterium]
MQVILLADVPKTGRKGDVLNVAEGYARNFLIPKGLAAEATKGKINELDRQNQLKAEQKQRTAEDARQLGRQLDGLRVAMTAKVGEAGKLFGAISGKDIADAVKAQHGFTIDKKKLLLDAPIKTLGAHEVAVKLHPQVQATITVAVTAE